MLLFTIPIAVVIGIIISRKYAPKTRSEKIWASFLIPLISGALIHLLVASCKNSGYGFAFDLGSTLLFVAIPEVALLITLLVSLEVGGKKDWNDTSTMKLHYGTGENRVDFEVSLTQKEILEMAKLREQDPERWKDNELELVKAVRKGNDDVVPIEKENKVQEPELLTDIPIETETLTEITTTLNDSTKNEFSQEKIMGEELLASNPAPTTHQCIADNNLTENNLLENESRLQENVAAEESADTKKEPGQTNVRTTKEKRGNKLSRCLKIMSIVALSLGIVFGLGVLMSFVYIKYVYPSKAKADDERLIREAKDNPSKAYEIAQELFKRDENGHQSEYHDFLSGKQGVCSYNHEQAGKEIANTYCQYMKEYAKRNISTSDEIAQLLFKNYDNHCNQLYNETGIEILKHAAEQGDSGAQFALGCYYNGLNYTKDDSWWSRTTIDNKKLDPTKAAYWYFKAAEQGNTAAMGNLGMAYIQGEGVNRNEQKGLGLIRSAAERGNAFYQCRLGDFYRDGVFMEIGSHKETYKSTNGSYFEKGDKVREYWDSDLNEWVGIYQKEVPDYKTILPKDIKQAQYWWKKAADNGDETAKERLQQIYE